jgi:TDG/mug DNA glycosylase family protein
MGFTRAELESYRDAVVPDLIGPDCKLLFVGINPGLWTAATGAHFARRGNRFYPALWRAGIVDRLIDASAGMSDEDRDLLLDRGIGITNVVPRASARADELTTAELIEGGRTLIETVTRVHPKVMAVAGITAYRTAFEDRKATAGRQDRTIGDTAVWVVPNPSGLNAHHTVDTLADAYRAAAIEAGVIDAKS